MSIYELIKVMKENGIQTLTIEIEDGWPGDHNVMVSATTSDRIRGSFRLGFEPKPNYEIVSLHREQVIESHIKELTDNIEKERNRYQWKKR